MGTTRVEGPGETCAVARTVDALMMETNGSGPSGNATQKALSMVRSLAPRDVEGQVALLASFELVTNEHMLRAKNEADKAGEAYRRATMRRDLVRFLMARVMSEREVRTVTLPGATITLNDGKESIAVTDIRKVPEAFVRMKPEADRAAARDHLRATGEVPDGFEVIIGEPYITVRRGA